MSPDKMVRMANQIATFFQTQPGVDAAAKVRDHLTDYWEPRMRQQLCDYVSDGGEGLDVAVISAVRSLSHKSSSARDERY
jgi:formate dehydrogenase subunit delta